MLKVDVLEAIRNPHQVRILLLLRARGPLRFNQIQDALRLNPAQVWRGLQRLDDGLWVHATTIPGTANAEKATVLVDWRLSKQGEQLLVAFDALVAALEDKRTKPGHRQLQALYPA